MREVTFNGAALPIQFGISAFNQYAIDNDTILEKALSNDGQVPTINSIVQISTYALNNAAARNGLDRRYTLDELWQMLDEDLKLLNQLIKAYTDAVVVIAQTLSGSKQKKEEQPAADQTK